MNNEPTIHESNAEDPRAIDRLADGELDDEGRRQLLASLDYTQDGWRRLALAYVEAQSWREDMGDLLRPADDSSPPAWQAGRKGQAGRTGRSLRPWTIGLAMAASFVGAFFLAWMFRGETREVDLAKIVGTAPTETTKVDELTTPNVPKPTAVDGLAEVGGPASAFQFDEAASLAAETDTAIDVPLLTVGTNGDPWDRVERPAMPPRIRQLLERLGHRVQTRRDLIPIELPSGQRGVVPVEQVEVEFQGPDAYQ